MIKKLKISNWNQFADVDLNFHPRLTVITGANGAGKSSILRILSRLVGWDYNETSTPNKVKTLKGKTGRFKIIKTKGNLIKDDHNNVTIGSITFEDNFELPIKVPENSDSAYYSMTLFNSNQFDDYYNERNIKGLAIPSHRIPYLYREVRSIPVKPISRKEAYENYLDSIKSKTIYDYVREDSPGLKMKESIINLAIYGKGNEFVEGSEESLNLFLGFIEVLKLLLPPTLGFQNITIRDGEVVFETKTGEFLLDSVSGGIGAILDLSWQIFMYDSANEPFMVVIDEAENHLHASMQRRLLPNLIQAFPNAQFIISTHSPLMVNSVKDSLVYILSYNENNAVVSQLLDFENKAANASQILRDVLGVPVTVPLWVENVLESTLEKYKGTSLNAETYTQLKKDLTAVGLSEHLPQALGYLQGGDLA
ncbi:AAA family ATPase [Brevibacillus laterosporus]|uniref:AAA family ATPase n=1 Tax=Brevibacillus laterosporus TaxID=1465 RepID=UPI001F099E0B|nr:ATP-binding protein [Brevibacillus laterosporus]